MPSQIMDQRPSYLFDEPCYPSQRFWNPDDHQGKKSNPSHPMDKLLPGRDNDTEFLEFSEPGLIRGQVAKLGIESRVVGAEKARNLSLTSWTSTDYSLGIGSNIFMQPASYATETNKVRVEAQQENGLFSNTLSEIFSKKVRLSTNNVVFRKFSSVVTSHHDEEEPLESLEDIEAQTIGNLLPDEDDLLSGANYNQECDNAQPNNRDHIEDFDLFSSGGGMELGEGDGLNSSQIVSNSDISGIYSNGLQKGVSSSVVAEHPYIENPSRTLFVRNVGSNVEDSELKALFEEYGDIRILYTACKHRGYVMISYYDIRAACAAIRSLQSKPLRHRNLDIHFSTPKDNPSEKDINQGILVVNVDFSLSNEDLLDSFGGYGEIKEIRESPYKRHQKFIEFYDVRAAEAALCALNRSDIVGKGVKLELNSPESMRPRSATLSSLEQEHGQSIYHQMGNSPHVSECFGSRGAISSNHVENESVQGLQSSFGTSVPISQFMETGLYQSLPPTVPHRLPSSQRISPAVQSGYGEPNITPSNMEFGFQRRPPFHPRSLSDYHGGLACGIPYNSPGTMEEDIGSRPREVISSGHNMRAGLNGHAVEPNESVYGSSNGSCPLHGKQSMWSNSNFYHSHPSDPLIWRNSPSFVNDHHSPQLHGLRRALPHMINAGLPVQHHVGSAPTANGSFWDPWYGYEGESYDTSEFHPGSLGSTGFSDYSALHHTEVNNNIFPCLGGNYMDLELANVEMQSSQQRYHMLPRRHSMIHMSNSFESNSERIISRSRSGANSSSQPDNKRHYDLDIDLILRGDDIRTTLMIKNIPNKYTSKMLLAAIDENHRGTYDFIYLPIDFKNKCNVGYAFINMINPSQIVPFYQTFHGKKWGKFNSEKVASLAYARIQGKAALISHFQNSSLMNEDKRCRPILFHSDGPNAGDQEPFPMGVNIRSRPGRGWANSSEENGEKASNITDSSSSSCDSARNSE